MPFADIRLARRLEENNALGCADLARARAALSPSSGATAMRIGGAMAVYTGPGWPVNRAHCLGLTGPVSAADLDQAEAFFRARGVAPQVELCPLADPSLVELLGQRAYRVAQFMNVFVRQLRAGESTTGTGSGIRVLKVPDDEADLWALTVEQGFAGHDHVVPNIAAANGRRPLVTRFLAFVGAEPAGGGLLTMRDGLASLGSASTRPPFRGRGVQTALLRARLDAAAAAGCDLATVITTPGAASQRNVERAGFRLAYTKLAMTGPA